MKIIKLDKYELIRNAGRKIEYSNEEIEMIQRWQSPGNDGISALVNQALSEGASYISTHTNIAHAIDVLSNACDKGIASHDFVVFRGEYDSDDFMKQGNDDAWKGKIIERKGFLSTSLSTPFSRPVQFRIEVPMGAHGIYIGHLAKINISGFYEDEFLIQKGSKLEIDHIERPDNNPIVFAKLII